MTNDTKASAWPWSIVQIISGGQTGADRAGLDWAIDHGIDHGGWCPQGRLATDGRIDGRYNLMETQSSGYRQRTRRNIESSDATLIFTLGPLVGGSLLTYTLAKKLAKPFVVYQLATNDDSQLRNVQDWLKEKGPRIINVAGPSESRNPEIYQAVYDSLDCVLLDEIRKSAAISS
ncbi:putative molybdenum carrier protein [Pseudomonas luteola]|uniref:putative molybdenum carrier protein n=1 Tax=Pseudomonas luteola TaxID=47886 RepID=UPI001EF4CEFC|nr:putative molybdenum carrier protein [Pseudomonas luteola]MCG7374097.1 putative molybdenum carrier protein [Pseudomonas luteola]